MKPPTRTARNLTRLDILAKSASLTREQTALMDLATIRPLTKQEESRFHALQLEIDEIKRYLPFR